MKRVMGSLRTDMDKRAIENDRKVVVVDAMDAGWGSKGGSLHYRLEMGAVTLLWVREHEGRGD